MLNSKESEKLEKQIEDLTLRVLAIEAAFKANAKVLVDIAVLVNLCAQRLEISDAEVKSTQLHQNQTDASTGRTQSVEAKHDADNSGGK